MEGINWIPIVVAALVPTIIGYLWYGPIMGKQWMASTGRTEEWHNEQGNLPMIMITSFVLAIMLSFALKILIFTTHGDQYMAECASIPGSHATFGHGAFHGVVYSAFLLIPFYVINGMFERRGPKNYWIHIVYWLITCGIMGGILDAWQ